MANTRRSQRDSLWAVYVKELYEDALGHGFESVSDYVVVEPFRPIPSRVWTDLQEVLGALADAFQFPRSRQEAAACDWNVTADLVGDLAWIFATPSTKKGVVALLRDPEPFMLSNLLQCTFLIDALGTQAQWILSKQIPFHIVVGPLPDDYRYEIFLNRMEVSNYFCEICQSVD